MNELGPADLPRIDLHRHLEGSIRPQTVLELGEQFGLPLPRDLAGVRALVQVSSPDPDLMAFIAKIDRAASVFVTPDACARVAYECVADAAADGLRYLELRFSPFYMAQPHGLDLDTVIEAVVDGVRRGQRERGVRANLIGILNRTYGPTSAARELEVLLAHQRDLVALDIAGDEAHYPGDLFVAPFRRAREAGLRLTIHAGEAAGPASVWQALRDLGAERIGHGVHAIEDPALLDELARRGTGIESRLTSNVQTSTVASYAAHPLRVFLGHGLRATINTDDPGVSGITLGHELTVAAPAAGLSPAQIRQAQANAIAVAFLSEGEKAELRAGRAPL